MRVPPMAIILLLALGSSSASAAPFIFYRGILNAASFAPQGLPNGSIARGSIFAIFGRDLGSAEGVTASSFPLGTNFQGVSIEVCQNGNCAQAIPLFVRADQINAIMPSNAPLGDVSVRVTFNGEVGNFSPATVAASSFGTFSINSGGFGPGVVQNFTPAAVPINSSVATAVPEQTVVLWGTGLGAGLNADNVAPQVGDLPVPVEIWVGGKAVTVKRYSGRTPCCSGLDQLVFDLPADAPTGCYVPVTIRAGSVVSNDTTIAISADGSPCVDAHNPEGAALRAGGNLGSITLLRGRSGAPGERVGADLGLAVFSEEAGGPWAYHESYISPPPGTCLVSVGTIRPDGSPAIGSPSSIRALDAGATLAVVTSDTGRELAPLPESLGYLDFLGPFSDVPLEADILPGILEPPRNVAVQGNGGMDVDEFNVSVSVGTEPAWAMSPPRVVDRSHSLTVSWHAVPGQLAVVGTAAASTSNAQVSFVCPMPDGATSFTVGSHVLGRLPGMPPFPASPNGLLAISVTRDQDTVGLDAAGLDHGSVTAVAASVEQVEFR